MVVFCAKLAFATVAVVASVVVSVGRAVWVVLPPVVGARAVIVVCIPSRGLSRSSGAVQVCARSVGAAVVGVHYVGR